MNQNPDFHVYHVWGFFSEAKIWGVLQAWSLQERYNRAKRQRWKLDYQQKVGKVGKRNGKGEFFCTRLAMWEL